MAFSSTINYDTAGNFTFDSSKITVASGKAELVLQQADEDYNQPFDSSAGFTFNAAETEFTGGQVQQLDQRPTDASFGALYDTTIDAQWGDGSTLTGTAVGGAAISGGKLDVKDFGKYVDYDASGGNANHAQLFTVKFKFTPDYTTTPSAWVAFWSIANSAGSLSNRVEMRHSPSAGQIQFRTNNSVGTSIGTFTLANWTPTAGVTYEIEANLDFNGGTSRVFIDGVEHDNFTATGTRSTAATLLRVGADYDATDECDGEFEDFVVFSGIEHTSGYTPGYTLPATTYGADEITLPAFTHSGPAGSSVISFDAWSATEAGAPRYTLTAGGTERYWDGAAWSASSATYATASSSADFATNIATYPFGSETTFTAKIYTDDSNTQSSVADLNLETTAETTYPTDDPTIVNNSGVLADSLESFAEVATAAGADEVRYTILVDSADYYWTGSAWATSLGTFAQANSAADINTNRDALDTVISTGVTLKVKAFLHSDDGQTAPDLTSVTIGYDFFAGAAAPGTTCIVYGYLYDGNGSPLSGATVSAIALEDDLFSGDVLVRQAEDSTTTNVNGYWELPLLESGTKGYAFLVGPSRQRFFRRVPGTSTAAFKDLAVAT